MRDWAAYILTYYPSFTGPRDPENANYGLNCVGHCNGQILVSIENVGRNAPGPANPKAQFHTDYIARNILGNKRDWEIETAWPAKRYFSYSLHASSAASWYVKHIVPRWLLSYSISELK